LGPFIPCFSLAYHALKRVGLGAGYLPEMERESLTVSNAMQLRGAAAIHAALLALPKAPGRPSGRATAAPGRVPPAGRGIARPRAERRKRGHRGAKDRLPQGRRHNDG
jgi:hypothetical protein